MPQETNLNVAPYFDDFDSQNNYHKVLFKPAYPVQVRELNNIQSILQNQIEQLGTHFFKEGSKVIPGQTTLIKQYYGIQIEPEYLNIPVSIYLDKLIGKKIIGKTSGITARVLKYITNINSDRDTFTIYINYIEPSTTDSKTKEFFDNEVLLVEESIEYATTFIAAGEGFSKTISDNASIIGSAFGISEGVYYLRGNFVNVNTDVLILDQYSTTPTYRIGFDITETVISSEADPNLNDNAQGFNNYTAPGADRLKIEASLSKKEIDDFDDQNFIQIAEVQNGVIRKLNNKTDYNILGDELAKRTFDESGHYYVKQFITTVKDSLNDGLGNNGIFNSDQITYSGNVPSDDLGCYKVSSGKAYVKGHSVETLAPTFVDFEKPRTTKKVTGQAVNFDFGPTLTVNRCYGSATIGFNTTNTLSLRSEYCGSDQKVAAGKEIGISRIYDMNLESGSYDTTNPATNRWDLTLFDVQSYTDISVGVDVTLSIPTYIEGQSSGATGFLRYPVSAGTAITAYNTNGSFMNGERLKFNGVDTDSRSIISSKTWGIGDVQSVFGIVGTAKTFSADTLLEKISNPIIGGFITVASAGVSTMTVDTDQFNKFNTNHNVGDLFTTHIMSQPTTDPYRFKIKSLDATTNKIVIENTPNIAGLWNGTIPTTSSGMVAPVLGVTTAVNLCFPFFPLTIKKPQLRNQSAQSIYSQFPKENVEIVDLENSNLIIRKQFDVSITNSSTSSISSGLDEVFLPFDEERYTLIRSNGSLESLTSDKFQFNTGSTSLVINGLGANDSNCVLITTLRKNKIKAKTKVKNSSNSIIINKSINSSSGTGSTTLNDGLDYGNFPFGTRVQDSIISLNIPDVIQVYGVFESRDTTDPESPSFILSGLNGPTSTTNDLIIGESIYGKTSKSRATYVGKKTDASANFVYKNTNTFVEQEEIIFEDSKINAILTSIDTGSINVTNSFKFISGQKETFLDYSRIKRKEDASIPKNKLKIYFKNLTYDSSDTGDITVTNSYQNANYSNEIQIVDGNRLTDIVDARPIVNQYVVSADSRSPLEFYGRNFDNSQNSSKDVLASDESMTIDFTYYLPRIDSIYLTKDGQLSLKKGVPNDIPNPPVPVGDSINIANISLPAYLYDVSDCTISFSKYKRYQMADISKLEKRISNLEYYTSLNKLESETISQFVPDSEGLNRFKNGIIVDNFTSLDVQDPAIGIKNKINRNKKLLKPSKFTTSINLQVGNSTISGIGATNALNSDSKFADIVGTNVKRSGQTICLNYNEVEWLNQPFATRSENVTPFLVKFWGGNIKFFPSEDTWMDTRRASPKNVSFDTGVFDILAEQYDAEIETNADGLRSGAGLIEGPWETDSVDVDLDVNTSKEVIHKGPTGKTRTRKDDGVSITSERHIKKTEVTTSVTTSTQINQTKEMTDVSIGEKVTTESLGSSIVDIDYIQYMRSRNIEFKASKLQPSSTFYAFFDGQDVNEYCFSKMIEIDMISGIFEIGETIIGNSVSSESTESNLSDTSSQITFRVASPNHKYGAYNNPSDVFVKNPYNREEMIPSSYTETSTILNCDTYSLASDENPEFKGNINKGMRLRGQSSGAEATVSDVRLRSDRLGVLIGNFRVPDAGNSNAPEFETGRSTFRLTTSETNSQIGGFVDSSAEGIFFSQGQTNTSQEVTMSLKTATLSHDETWTESRSLNDTSTSTDKTVIVDRDSKITDVNLDIEDLNTRIDNMPTADGDESEDPLAQTFLVDSPIGLYLSSAEFYFHKKDSDGIPVTVQIREVRDGTPTNIILPFSEVDMYPDDIVLSENASESTKFTFETPVYLSGQKWYSIVLLSASTEYKVFISHMGEVDITGVSGPESGQNLVSQQPTLGSLFKSQNAETWTPSQYEDLHFKLNRADFVTGSLGSFELYNPKLPDEMEIITKDGLKFLSKKIKIKSPIAVTQLTSGNTVYQNGTTAQGNFVGYAGSISNMVITSDNVGAGYTPSSGSYTFTGIALTSFTGDGTGATASIVVNNGELQSATITNSGNGYQIGDVLIPIEIGNSKVGRGGKITVSTLSGNNEIVINDIQGEFDTTNYLRYENNSGTVVDLHSQGVIPSNVRVLDDGLHFEVFHRNHGMNSSSNLVTLRDVSSDVVPTTLSVNYSSSSTDAITIGSTSSYVTFENLGVGATNPGYVKVGSEIIKYTGFSGNTLTGITRGIDNTLKSNHYNKDLVYKYEIDGVSLRRINKTHNLNTVTKTNAITLDSYNIKVDMSDTDYGTNRSNNTLGKLFFNNDKSSGGVNCKASYNIPFSTLTPNINIMTPAGTSITADVRTITSSSIDGSENSYVDKGFETISLTNPNSFNDMRMVASSINESTYCTNLPGNKSFSMGLNLYTANSFLTPLVDLDKTSVILTSNRINQPITDYQSDFRSNLVSSDPNKFLYVTKNISLQNPSTSITVYLDAYLVDDNDIRVFYAFDQEDIPVNETIFYPFPGHKNIGSNGLIIDKSKSDGSSDTKVPKNDIYTSNPSLSDYREYKFSMMDLSSPFSSFRIKIIGTSTNQAQIPMIKNLRITSFA